MSSTREYLVEVTTTGVEHYLVEATSEQEALSKWEEGEMIKNETQSYSVESITEQD